MNTGITGQDPWPPVLRAGSAPALNSEEKVMQPVRHVIGTKLLSSMAAALDAAVLRTRSVAAPRVKDKGRALGAIEGEPAGVVEVRVVLPSAHRCSS
jgi:hypothetical protein